MGDPAATPRSSIRVERDGAAAFLLLDRPERFNALDLATARDLRAAGLALARDPEVRCMVLRVPHLPPVGIRILVVLLRKLPALRQPAGTLSQRGTELPLLEGDPRVNLPEECRIPLLISIPWDRLVFTIGQVGLD